MHVIGTWPSHATASISLLGGEYPVYRRFQFHLVEDLVHGRPRRESHNVWMAEYSALLFNKSTQNKLYIITPPYSMSPSRTREFCSVVEGGTLSPSVQRENKGCRRRTPYLAVGSYSHFLSLYSFFLSFPPFHRRASHSRFLLSLFDRIWHCNRHCTFCFELLEHRLTVAFHYSSFFKVLDLQKWN